MSNRIPKELQVDLQEPSEPQKQQMLMDRLSRNDKSSVNYLALIESIGKMTPGAQRDEKLKKAVADWIGKDMDGALVYINTLPEAKQVELLSDNIGKIVEQDVTRALIIAEKFSGNRNAQNLNLELIKAYSKIDLDAAGQKAFDMINAGKLSPRALFELAGTWSEFASPEKIVSWSKNIKDTRAQDFFEVAALRSWARQDVEKAAQYIQSLPDG